MKIMIKETSVAKTLSIIDPNSGVDFIKDFVGNTGAFIDGQFQWDEDRDCYVCDQDTFDWWDTVVTDVQSLDYRIHELVAEHGSEAVNDIVHEAAAYVDLEDHAATVNEALNEAFGLAE